MGPRIPLVAVFALGFLSAAIAQSGSPSQSPMGFNSGKGAPHSSGTKTKGTTIPGPAQGARGGQNVAPGAEHVTYPGKHSPQTTKR